MTLSIVFFILYICVAVTIGIVSSRKETEEGFMMADRKVQWLQVASSMSAWFFDGATLSIYMAYMYVYGFSAVWMFGWIALWFLLLKKYAYKIKQKADELHIYSMPEYFFKILGKSNGLMFSFFLVIQFFLLLIVNLIISGKVLSSIFPISYSLSVAIGGLVVLSYLLLAGFKAVVRTDVFQMIIMFIMGISVAIFLFGKTPLPPSVFTLGSMWIGNTIWFLLLTGLGIMVAPDIWQRIFATKNESNLRRWLNYASIFILLLWIIVSVVGLSTKYFFPGIIPEDALVTGFSHLLPYGLKELGMVLLYAVTLSSSDTVVFVVSSIFTRDLKNYSKKYSDESMKKLTRFFIVVFIVLGVCIGIRYQKVMNLWFALASLNLALFPVVFGSLYRKLNRKAVFWSLVLGFISIVLLFFTNQLNPENSIISLPVVLLSLFVLHKLLKKETYDNA